MCILICASDTVLDIHIEGHALVAALNTTFVIPMIHTVAPLCGGVIISKGCLTYSTVRVILVGQLNS